MSCKQILHFVSVIVSLGHLYASTVHGTSGQDVPGVSLSVTNTQKFNDYYLPVLKPGNIRNRTSATTSFSAISNSTHKLGERRIDANFSASNVVDWIRMTHGTPSATLMIDGNGRYTTNGQLTNRKAGVGGDRLRAIFSGAGSFNTRAYYTGKEQQKNIRINYTDGVDPVQDSSSYMVVRDSPAGADATDTLSITAPSENRIKRTLDVYVAFEAPGSANHRVLIEASIDNAAGTKEYEISPIEETLQHRHYATDYTPGVGYSSGGYSGRFAAKYSFDYTGDADGKPLVVRITQINNAEASTGRMFFYGASISRQRLEPEIFITTPDMVIDTYAMRVPTSMFNRRTLPVKVYNKGGYMVYDTVRDNTANPITYSVVGAPGGAYAGAAVPGVTVEKNEKGLAMLYVRPGIKATMEVDITATVKVGGQTASTTRRAKLIYNADYKDGPRQNAPIAPLKQNASDWSLYFNDEFERDELDPTAWIPYYFPEWSEDKDYPEAIYEMVKEGGRSYFVLSSKEDRLGGTEGSGGNISAIQTRVRHHTHLLEHQDSGGARCLDAENSPDFDGLVTKYGFFELRMRFPNAGDGSHFAWWMVGAQDDQHPDMALSGPKPTGGQGRMNPGGPGGWGNWVYYLSDQGVEYDILEMTTDIRTGNNEYNLWLPPLHKNGSRSFPSNPNPGRWYAGLDVPKSQRFNAYAQGRDFYQEFHTYGFEWDENGTKFYFDGDLVYTSPRTADFRMLTFLSVYAGRSGPSGDGSYGYDHAYWPKEAFIDYFRVYKRNQASKPTSIVINGRRNTSWDWFRVPASGSNKVQLSATVLDQFDRPYQLTGTQSIKWRFSDDVGGSNPLTAGAKTLLGGGSVTYPEGWDATNIGGITLDQNTGLVTIPSTATLACDIFLTAYIADSADPTGYYGGKFTVSGDIGNEVRRDRAKIQETKYVKLSGEAPRAHRIFFDNPVHEIVRGKSVSVSATLYDQYNNPMPDAVSYSFSKDVIRLNERGGGAPKGLSLSGNTLSASKSAKLGEFVVITARAGGKHQSLTLKVTRELGKVNMATSKNN